MNLRLKPLLGLALSCVIGTNYAQTADSVKIAVQGGGPAVMTANTLGTASTTLQLNSTVYPPTIGQGTTWRVLPGGTASGSISTTGLLTVPALTSGYIWVKGISSVDTTKADSVKVLVYCKPSHTNPLNWFVIDTVHITGTSLYSGTATLGNTGAYTLFPANSATTGTITKGNNYTLNTQVTSYGSFAPDTTLYTYSVSAWIDYNRNGVFESSEWLAVEDSALNRFASYNFTVPSTASAGPAMMRIRSRLYGSINGVSDMCASYTGSGQTEDYIITIEEQPTCAGEPGPNPGDLGCVSFIYNGQTVIYPAVRGNDGNIWLQKNLGAARIAASSTDADAFGDVFQWGRWADGHQRRTATISTTAPVPNNPSGLGIGINTFFTTSPAWWNLQSLTDTWQGATPAAASATNGCDPCRQLGAGWRLPAVADWQAIVAAETITSPAAAYASHLKLPVSGVRNSSGGYDFVGVRGYYWSNEPATTGGKYFYFSSAIINPTAGGPRAQGAAIRCMKSFKVDSVKVSVLNNVAPVITVYKGVLQLLDTVYPAYINQNVKWSIIPVTGSATVNNTGLVSAQTDGTVWAKVISLQDTTKADSILINISNQVIPIDSVVISVANGLPPIITAQGSTLQMNSTVYPITANPSVNWKVIPVTGNAIISINGLVTATASGTVWAKVISVQDTTKADSILLTISDQTGIADVSNMPVINLYPNPAKDHIVIKAVSVHPAMTISIYNMKGQQMASHAIAEDQLLQAYSFDISSFAPGLYLLRLNGGTNQENLLFTIEK